MTGKRFLRSILAGGACALVLAGAAAAETRAFDVSGGDLKQALDAYVRQSGVQLVYSVDAVRGARSHGAHGSLSPEQALAEILAGTPFVVERDASGAGAIVRSDARPQDPGAPAPTAIDELVVTGSRIKGVAPSSPVITLTQNQIREAGLTNAGEVFRSLPQNFNGGQNPGVALGAAGGNIANQNITGGSSINLRGLGPDATLTLLNGRRLAYDGYAQAIDVSNIPLAAISNIQVVTDGASAIYGSDAVAGVANIILKRDFDGVTTSARYGAATEGGGSQAQYNVVFGGRWDTGGFIATADYTQQGQILAGQRDYSGTMPPEDNLYPTGHQIAGLVSAHQDLGSFVHLKLDALYSERKSLNRINSSTFHAFFASDDKQFAVSPTIGFDLPHGWTAEVNGLIGKDRNFYNEPFMTTADVLISPAYGCDCNNTRQVEADAEGPLFRLPGGDARLAVGAGYRENWLNDFNRASGSSLNGRRSSYYAFGEINLPLVSAEQELPGMHSLIVNGAVRYEDYSDIGDIATPKLGLIWSPVSDIDVKASWGRSFKAPTLIQQYQRGYTQLEYASDVGGTGTYPPTATVLFVGGGNTDLKPERAETATAGLTYHPSAAPGLKLEAGYFWIRYRDRVAEPFAGTGQALSNPIYAPYVTFAPTLEQQAEAIARGAGSTFYNYTSDPYDPATVVAIIDDSYTNVARQLIDGVDLTGSYTRPLGDGSITVMGTGSWMKLSQQFNPGAPEDTKTGTVFNPPHFRGRAGVVWANAAITVAGYVNHQSGLINTNFSPAEPIRGQTTLDINAVWRLTAASGLLHDTELSLTVNNVFDAKPPYMRPVADYVADYDSLNYSPIGRFISLTVTKHW